jgi:mRNA interferase YafQ
MKPLRIAGQYRKDLRLMGSRGYNLDKLARVIDHLRQGIPLSPIYDDHPLKGEWQSFRECHIQGDWLLIYRHEDDNTLALVRTGTHSDLFE